jgi:hypothetical protein
MITSNNNHLQATAHTYVPVSDLVLRAQRFFSNLEQRQRITMRELRRPSLPTAFKDPLISTKTTAGILGIKQDTLKKWRARKKGPEYVRVGRSIKYRLSVLQKFFDDNTVIEA